MDLTITTEPRAGWVVVRVAGDLDLATAPRLRSAVVDLVTRGSTSLVLDLEGVDFVDSMGLGVIVGAARRTRSNGGDLRLVSRRQHVRQVLELTGLDTAFPPFDDVESATAAEGSSGA